MLKILYERCNFLYVNDGEHTGIKVNATKEKLSHTFRSNLLKIKLTTSQIKYDLNSPIKFFHWFMIFFLFSKNTLG